MENFLNRGLTLGTATALVGAGLIATTPTAPPIPLPAPAVQHFDVHLTTDVFTALANNIDSLFTYGWDALTSLAGLHLSEAATDLNISIQNVLFMPENLIIGGLAALTGDASPNFLSNIAFAFTGDIFGWLGMQLQTIVQYLDASVTNLFSLHLADAYNDVTFTFDLAVLGIPGELIVGPLIALGL